MAGTSGVQGQAQPANNWQQGWLGAGKGAPQGALYPGQEGRSQQAFPSVNPHTGQALTQANWNQRPPGAPQGAPQQAQMSYNFAPGQAAALGADINAVPAQSPQGYPQSVPGLRPGGPVYDPYISNPGPQMPATPQLSGWGQALGGMPQGQQQMQPSPWANPWGNMQPWAMAPYGSANPYLMANLLNAFYRR